MINVSSLSQQQIAAIARAAKTTERVAGWTHTSYRYPARFSPLFVRTCLAWLTAPGDLIYDPFCGGGTTIVEAYAHGRIAVGTDINELSIFVSKAKTQRIDSDKKRCAISLLERRLSKSLSEILASTHEIESVYAKSLKSVETWRLQVLIAHVLDAAKATEDHKIEQFIRFVLLGSSQWALDGRKSIPTVDEFRRHVLSNADTHYDALTSLHASAKNFWRSAPIIPKISKSAASSIPESLFRTRAPKLVITSPPYPGVHILYHRWQVRGRRETGAPYWISNSLDGAGAAHYTMGRRYPAPQEDYFAEAKRNFAALNKICDRNTVVVQVIGFSKIDQQLPLYLDVMRDTGFQPIEMPLMKGLIESNELTRVVPNRRWHSSLKGITPASNEVILIHRRS